MAHFVRLKLICQASSKRSTADRFLWSSSLSASLSITLKSMLSSAKSLLSEEKITVKMDSGRRLMKQRNRSGTGTVPCRTPGMTSAVSDFTPSRITCWLLWLQKRLYPFPSVFSHSVVFQLVEKS